MKTVVFCVYPMVGAINSSFKLAKIMRNQGWRIYYFGVSECRHQVELQGFDFVTIYEGVFTDDGCDDGKNWFYSYMNYLGWLRRFYKKYKYLINALATGEDQEVTNLFKKYSPDFVLILTTEYDSIIWALLVNKLGIKCAYLSSILGHSEGKSVPPFYSSSLPCQSFFGIPTVYFEWKKYFLLRRLKGFLKSLFGIGVSFDFAANTLAKGFEYPRERINNKTDLLAPLIDIPEFVLWPKIFDFKNTEQVGRHYIEPSIDLDRYEGDFPWDRIDNNAPIIYCAMGTVVSRKKKEYVRFYNVILKTACEMPHIQWVIALGALVSPHEFDVIPDNVLLVKNAPQISLLKKAKYMISHGGANSVKECILLGVSMIVCPLEFDHFGNSAKVFYHKLGLRGSFENIDTNKMIELITELDVNPIYKENVIAMQKQFNQLEQAVPSIKIIESMLENHV